MARHFNDFDDDREPGPRRDRFAREQPWNYNRPYSGARLENDYGQRDFGQGRFRERAGYETDEPRYNQYSDQYAREEYRRPSYEGRDRGLGYRNADMDYQPRSRYGEAASRSRLRVRDIMTRNLAVATRDTSLHDVARMMKEEDTGVIPVVEFRTKGGNGGNGGTEAHEARLNTSNYSHGKLVGLITDRDIVLRAVAEGKDCNANRAEEVMSTDVHTARPHERVVDVITRMGDKQVRRIPITNENGNLLGIVSMGDVAVETEADRELADALEDISRESSFWGRLFG
ncbi:MAG TPA: CBS domain-containing protein [Pyrinomonadaceae bacterium]|nr:CBS domain-containing protein [Pyrinomonadaceae bacterium]